MSDQKQLSQAEKLKLQEEKERRRQEFLAKNPHLLSKEKGSTPDKVELSKSERKKAAREKQEADRAAKNQLKSGVSPTNSIGISKTTTPLAATKDKENVVNRSTIRPSIKTPEAEGMKKKKNPVTPQTSLNDKLNVVKNVDEPKQSKLSPIAGNKLTKKGQLFPHIPKRETDLEVLTQGFGYDGAAMHPDIIRIGLQINQNLIVDPTSQCIAFLCALKLMINDYEPTVACKSIARDLETRLDAISSFLDRCRPLSLSMRNVIRIIRNHFSKVSSELSVDKVRTQLAEVIEKFLYEEIECGLDGIKEHGSVKIHDGDVVMTFGNSFLVRHIFGKAMSDGKKFKVILVDSNPRLEGHKMLEYLIKIGIDTTYILINAVAHVMKEATKVLLEANTLLANGYMMAELGSSQIALVAKAHNVPVLISCETYKFSDRVHTDSFVYNEAAPVNEFFIKENGSSNLKAYIETIEEHATSTTATKSSMSNLNILNLYYDITPPDFISLVITEMGFLPCTAVPAIIRRNISKFQLEA